MLGDLGGEAGGVPVLPGFDETAVLDTDNRGTGDLGGLAARIVLELGNPANAGQIAFSEGDHRGNFEIGKNSAQAVVEFFEFSGAANNPVAIVDDAVWSEQLRDGVAVAFVPDFFKPADDELFVLIERGYGGGGHEGYLLAGIGWSIQECGKGGERGEKIKTETRSGLVAQRGFCG